MRRGICGVSGLAPRENESFPLNVRLNAEDAAYFGHKYGRTVRPGLYQVCADVRDEQRQRLAERLGKRPEEISRGQLC